MYSFDASVKYVLSRSRQRETIRNFRSQLNQKSKKNMLLKMFEYSAS